MTWDLRFGRKISEDKRLLAVALITRACRIAGEDFENCYVAYHELGDLVIPDSGYSRLT